jgi:hypothetical protein
MREVGSFISRSRQITLTSGWVRMNQRRRCQSRNGSDHPLLAATPKSAELFRYRGVSRMAVHCRAEPFHRVTLSPEIKVFVERQQQRALGHFFVLSGKDISALRPGSR